MTIAGSKRPTRFGGDDGAALPMALAFVSVIGVIVGVLLTQAAVNFRATVVLRDQRDRVFAADAGLEWVLARAAAIATAAGTGPVSCTSTLTVNNATVVLACSGDANGFNVTSTASKAGSSTIGRAVIAKTAVGYTPTSWDTGTD